MGDLEMTRYSANRLKVLRIESATTDFGPRIHIYDSVARARIVRT